MFLVNIPRKASNLGTNKSIYLSVKGKTGHSNRNISLNISEGPKAFATPGFHYNHSIAVMVPRAMILAMQSTEDLSSPIQVNVRIIHSTGA